MLVLPLPLFLSNFNTNLVISRPLVAELTGYCQTCLEKTSLGFNSCVYSQERKINNGGNKMK